MSEKAMSEPRRGLMRGGRHRRERGCERIAGVRLCSARHVEQQQANEGDEEQRRAERRLLGLVRFLEEFFRRHEEEHRHRESERRFEGPGPSAPPIKYPPMAPTRGAAAAPEVVTISRERETSPSVALIDRPSARTSTETATATSPPVSPLPDVAATPIKRPSIRRSATSTPTNNAVRPPRAPSA